MYYIIKLYTYVKYVHRYPLKCMRYRVIYKSYDTPSEAYGV